MRTQLRRVLHSILHISRVWDVKLCLQPGDRHIHRLGSKMNLDFLAGFSSMLPRDRIEVSALNHRRFSPRLCAAFLQLCRSRACVLPAALLQSPSSSRVCAGKSGQACDSMLPSCFTFKVEHISVMLLKHVHSCNRSPAFLVGKVQRLHKHFVRGVLLRGLP